MWVSVEASSLGTYVSPQQACTICVQLYESTITTPASECSANMDMSVPAVMKPLIVEKTSP